MQNIATKLWDSQGEIKGVRTVCDGRIVSYDLLVNNRHSTRHRKFLQKIYLPNDESREEVSIPESGIPEESVEAADRRVLDRAPSTQARPGRGRTKTVQNFRFIDYCNFFSGPNTVVVRFGSINAIHCLRFQPCF